ncbi:hypothetical protein IC582_014962 [Cucumis melo]
MSRGRTLEFSSLRGVGSAVEDLGAVESWEGRRSHEYLLHLIPNPWTILLPRLLLPINIIHFVSFPFCFGFFCSL